MRQTRSIRTLAAVAGIALIGVTTAACAGGGGGSSPTAGASESGSATELDMEPITLTLSEIVAENTADGIAVTEMMDYITEQSDGKITFDPYWASSLLNGPQTAEGIRSGVADLGRISVTNNPTEFPAAGWFTPMGAVPTKSYPMSNLVGVTTHIDMYNDPETPFYNDLTSTGLQPLAMNSAATNEMVCSKEISEPSDLEGLQVRVPGPPYAGEVTALGMTPVSMPSAEIYEALERGVLDCAVVSTTFMFQADLFSVAKSYLPLSLSANTGGGYAVNKELWNGLPEAAQKIIQEGAAIFSAGATRGQMEERQTLPSTLEEAGVALVDMTDFIPIVDKYQKKTIDDLAGSAPASVTDPEALIEAYQASIEENETAITDLGVEEMKKWTPEAWTSAFETGADQVDWDAYRELILASIDQG